MNPSMSNLIASPITTANEDVMSSKANLIGKMDSQELDRDSMGMKDNGIKLEKKSSLNDTDLIQQLQQTKVHVSKKNTNKNLPLSNNNS